MDLITLNKYYFPLLHGAGGKYDELIVFRRYGSYLNRSSVYVMASQRG